MTAAATPSRAETPDRAITAFRIVAIAEAISWGALLVAMLFKYALVESAVGVRVVGPIHGMMFIGYLIATLTVGTRCRWKPSTIIIGLLAAVPPFMTIVFERWVERSGLLQVAEPDLAT